MDSRNCVGVICETYGVDRLEGLDIDVPDPPTPKGRLAQTESVHPQCSLFQPVKFPSDDAPRCGLLERSHKQSPEMVVQNNMTTLVSRVDAHYRKFVKILIVYEYKKKKEKST